MSHSVHFVVPGPIRQATGGYIYDRRIVLGLRALGRSVTVHELAGTFPVADASARAAAAACLEAADVHPTLVIDGLALPAFAGLAGRIASPWTALVHHPLALETGLDPAAADALTALEKRLLRQAGRIIATSRRTRRDLTGMGIDPARIGVVPPGTDPAPPARGARAPCPTLLCVASLIPRKGHLILLEALARLRDLGWRLVCAGSTVRDAAAAAAVRAAVERLGLQDRVEILGEVAETLLAGLYHRADVFVLASHHEGYGMALAEALARGLPIVATTVGAIPDTVPAGAGILVAPGDPVALALALRKVLSDPAVAAGLREKALSARGHLASWEHAARTFARELDRLV